MTVLIILAVLLYMGIGGLICGLCDEYDLIAFYVIFWPIFVLYLAFIGVAELPYRLGRRIDHYFRYRKENR